MEPQQTAALVRRTQRGLSVQARAFGATAMPSNVRTEYYRGVMHRRSGAVAKDQHDPCGGIFSLKGFFPNDECREQILLEQGRIKRRPEEEKEREIEQTEQVRKNLEQKDREEEWVRVCKPKLYTAMYERRYRRCEPPLQRASLHLRRADARAIGHVGTTPLRLRSR